MKFYWHHFWYLMVLVGLAGLVFGWTAFDPWFPMFAVAMAQLSRLRSGLPETWLDKIFSGSHRAQLIGALSVVVVLSGITAYAAWVIYFDIPRNDRASVQEYLKDREAYLQQERSK